MIIKWNNIIPYYIHVHLPCNCVVFAVWSTSTARWPTPKPPAKAGDQNMTLWYAKAVAHAYGNGMVCPWPGPVVAGFFLQDIRLKKKNRICTTCCVLKASTCHLWWSHIWIHPWESHFSIWSNKRTSKNPELPKILATAGEIKRRATAVNGNLIGGFRKLKREWMIYSPKKLILFMEEILLACWGW